MAKISVLGAGSWGTALSILLSNNGHEVRLWSRFQEEVDALRETRELTSKLPGVHMHRNSRSACAGRTVSVYQKHIKTDGT